MSTRRQFIRSTGLGVLAYSLPAASTFGTGIQKCKLSMQLYTVREQIKEDIRGTLKRLSRIGFKNVETAFWPEGVSLDRAAASLKENNLKVSSCHIELPVGEYRKTFIDTAKAFECNDMIWHGWPEDSRYSTLEGTRELIKIYNVSCKFAKDNGLKFGLHNHWWEYRNKVGGKFVYEILLDELDPDIFFEVDTYWVKVAGHDPAKIVSELGSRVRSMHIKDGPAMYNDRLAIDNPDPMTPVGKGTQDFPSIFNAAASSCEWLIIEMDKTANDVFEALEESIRYIEPFVVK